MSLNLGSRPVDYERGCCGLVLRYGLTPGCKPTGRTEEIRGIAFVEIGPGCFRMGSHYQCVEGDLLGRLSEKVGLPWGTKPSHSGLECPLRWVEFEDGFWIGRYEVTNAEFERFRPDHERTGYSPGPKHPVVNVSWEDATDYCAWLSRETGLDIRLPSEAEWECACRAGIEDGEGALGSADRLADEAWFEANAGGRCEPVGTRRASPFGLFDLLGNAGEWTADSKAPILLGGFWSSTGLTVRFDVAARGGSFDEPAENLRPAKRSLSVRTGQAHQQPDQLSANPETGFRLCFSRVRE